MNEKTDRIFSSVYLDVTSCEGLKYKFLIGVDMHYVTGGIFEGRFTNPGKNGKPAALNTRTSRTWATRWKIC